MKAQGFNLLELVISTSILIIVTTYLLPQFKILAVKESENRKLISNLYLIEQEMERIKYIPFDQIETNGNLKVTKLDENLKKIEIKLGNKHIISTLRYKI